MHIIAKALRWAGMIAGAAALYLLTVALMPGFPQPKQALARRSRQPDKPAAKPFGTKESVRFEVDGIGVHGWLYLPQDVSAPVACVVMAHGLGGTVDMGLAAYALRFQEAGYAVLAFDYRHFGRSQGQPRQLIWIPTQLADWRAAVRYIRERPEIDAARVALWGTSLSGGHVVVTAAEDTGIACIAAQCPGLDGHEGAEMAFKRIGVRGSAKMIVHGQRDLVRSWLGLSAHKIPIVGRPGTVALMASDEAWDAFAQLAPAGFINEACARITIRGDKYRPVKKAQHVRCPALLQICEEDTLTPVGAAEETARQLGALAEAKRYPIGHFDIYFGDQFERAVNDQLAFFRKHM